MAGGLRRWIWKVVHRSRLAFVDKLGPYVDPLAVGLLGTFVVIGAIVLGFGALTDFAGWIAATALATFTVYLQARASRHNAILNELTTSYILSGRRDLLDDLLGQLINGIWSRSEIMPGAALFDALEKIADSSDNEMKRRIAEALPALALINVVSTLRLMKILRGDWHERWRSDVGRRVVESLTIPAGPSRPLLIELTKPVDLNVFLKLRDQDEIWAAMAIVEALAVLERDRWEIAQRLREEFFADAHRLYGAEDVAALELLQEMLLLAVGAPEDALDRARAALTSVSLFDRVAAARVVVLFCEQAPASAMNLLELIAQDSHKYVKRPLARERCMRFLLKCTNGGVYRDRARALVTRMLTDEDEIVAVTAFDLIEHWTSGNGELLRSSCDLILSRADCSRELRERVLRARRDLELPIAAASERQASATSEVTTATAQGASASGSGDRQPSDRRARRGRAGSRTLPR